MKEHIRTHGLKSEEFEGEEYMLHFFNGLLQNVR